jgi:lipase chaperone LimK
MAQHLLAMWVEHQGGRPTDAAAFVGVPGAERLEELDATRIAWMAKGRCQRSRTA